MKQTFRDINGMVPLLFNIQLNVLISGVILCSNSTYVVYVSKCAVPPSSFNIQHLEACNSIICNYVSCVH